MSDTKYQDSHYTSDLSQNETLQALRDSDEMKEQREAFFAQRKEALDKERASREFKEARRTAIKNEQIEKCYRVYTPSQCQ